MRAETKSAALLAAFEHRAGYRARPAKRTYIPKADGSQPRSSAAASAKAVKVEFRSSADSPGFKVSRDQNGRLRILGADGTQNGCKLVKRANTRYSGSPQGG